MTTVASRVRAELRASIAEMAQDPELLAGLGDRTHLLGDGILDSFGMLELLTWIEDRYGLFIDFADDGDEQLMFFGGLADHVAKRTAEVDAA